MGKVRDYETREDTMDWLARAAALASIGRSDEVEYLSLEEYDNLVRVAHWHMRRAGMTPLRPGMVTPISSDGDVKTMFLVGGVFAAVTVVVMTLIRVATM